MCRIWLIVTAVAGLVLSGTTQARALSPASQPAAKRPAHTVRARAAASQAAANPAGRWIIVRSPHVSGGDEITRLAQEVGLAPQQQMQARIIWQQAQQDEMNKAAAVAQKAQIRKAALDKIYDTVLTGPQRDVYVEIHYVNQQLQRLGSRTLTADQQAEVTKVVAQTRADAAKAETLKQKRDVWSTAFHRIDSEILTPQQEKIATKHGT